MSFENIAPYLKDPLVLVGFVLLLFFGLARSMIKSGVIGPVRGNASYRLLQTILLYGFLLGIAIAALGFGLKYRELSETEQRNALSLLRGEFDANVATIEQLRQNTFSLLTTMTTIAAVLRTPDVPVIATLFPAANIRDGETTSASELALAAAQALTEKNLDHNAKEMARAQALAVAVRRTIDETQGTVQSLADAENRRYVISDAVWRAQLPVLRQVMLPGVSQYQSTYEELTRVRANYNVVVGSVVSYLSAVRDFFNKSEPIDLDRLKTVLIQERQTFGLATTYGKSLTTSLEHIKKLHDELTRPQATR